MKSAVMVQGASRGLGLELCRQLLAQDQAVLATCRRPDEAAALQELAGQHPDRLNVVPLDLENEASIARAAEDTADVAPRLAALWNVAGILHDGDIGPEKKLGHVHPEHLARVFAINAFGPLLVAKHFAPRLLYGERAVIANLSARVGSIGDNRLGGWYAYRGSKAAQNMFTKNLAIELGRQSAHIIVVGLHPGTVDTALSKPFQRSVPKNKLFDIPTAARQLLDVVARLEPQDTGGFYAYDGSRIGW